eukprot:GILI01011737.1.p1 GENE.GILI01011737.1~~GILI01011737.1.p1  ORF type:complete len:326 (+),score=57.23 GILI01011737.1:82-1059(+)
MGAQHSDLHSAGSAPPPLSAASTPVSVLTPSSSTDSTTSTLTLITRCSELKPAFTPDSDAAYSPFLLSPLSSPSYLSPCAHSPCEMCAKCRKRPSDILRGLREGSPTSFPSLCPDDTPDFEQRIPRVRKASFENKLYEQKAHARVASKRPSAGPPSPAATVVIDPHEHQRARRQSAPAPKHPGGVLSVPQASGCRPQLAPLYLPSAVSPIRTALACSDDHPYASPASNGAVHTFVIPVDRSQPVLHSQVLPLLTPSPLEPHEASFGGTGACVLQVPSHVVVTSSRGPVLNTSQPPSKKKSKFHSLSSLALPPQPHSHRTSLPGGV